MTARYLNRQARTILVLISVLSVLSVVIDWFPRQWSSFRHSPLPETNSITTSYSVQRSKVGKLSMLYGEPNTLYERAIASHIPHNKKFGYPHQILRQQTLSGFWSKPGFVLQHLLTELSKPPSERLQWLVWFDADVVLMNPKIPLEIFLPPSDWSHIHCLVTNDLRGLNNGVFFLRINSWSVSLMSAVISTELFDPTMKIDAGDQSALLFWLNEEEFREGTMHVPQRWFNAYGGYQEDRATGLQQTQNTLSASSIRPGDLLVHLAGHKSLRSERITTWLDIAGQHLDQWELELEQTTYTEEIRDFWLQEALSERQRVDEWKAKMATTKRKNKAEDTTPEDTAKMSVDIT